MYRIGSVCYIQSVYLYFILDNYCSLKANKTSEKLSNQADKYIDKDMHLDPITYAFWKCSHLLRRSQFPSSVEGSHFIGNKEK